MFTIEHATLNDLPAIRALLASAALPVGDVDAALLGAMYVARDISGNVRGAAGVQRAGSDALLRSLVVAHDARSEGLGARLLAAAEGDACAAGITCLYLLTTSAAGFFSSRGSMRVTRDAVPEGIRRTAQLANMCPASSLLMADSIAG